MRDDDVYAILTKEDVPARVYLDLRFITKMSDIDREDALSEWIFQLEQLLEELDEIKDLKKRQDMGEL